MSITPLSSPLTPRDLIRNAPELVSAPEVLSRLMAALEDASAKRMQEITYLIEHDAALSARLLKMVNSPFYGMPRAVLSVEEAVRILGLQELRNLIVGTIVVERFSSLPNSLMSMRQFWQTSVRCALWAGELGRHLAETAPRPGDGLFLCGLLHDIGRLVVYRLLPEPARAACLQAATGHVTETSAIAVLLGFDYYEVAAALSRQWNLPELLAVTQQYHGAPLAAPQFRQEAVIVALASGLGGAPSLTPPPAEALPLLQYLGLQEAVLAVIKEDVEAQLKQVLGVLAGPHPPHADQYRQSERRVHSRP